ncbi:hypothetical protein, partial [Ferrimicrobium sp.]|uniref:hypothetical protein n=1 Tax=Ferrimicrobium sp. TaxID=2926050 RepID=UPI00261E4918
MTTERFDRHSRIVFNPTFTSHVLALASRRKRTSVIAKYLTGTNATPCDRMMTVPDALSLTRIG